MRDIVRFSSLKSKKAIEFKTKNYMNFIKSNTQNEDEPYYENRFSSSSFDDDYDDSIQDSSINTYSANNKEEVVNLNPYILLENRGDENTFANARNSVMKVRSSSASQFRKKDSCESNMSDYNKGEQSKTTEKPLIVYDRVHEFQIYYPQFNVKNIIEKYDAMCKL